METGGVGEPAHCIFTLDCILTLLRHIIAVCFISRSRSAAARKRGVGGQELVRLPILYLQAQKHSESSPNLKRSKVGDAVAASFRGTTLPFPPPSQRSRRHSRYYLLMTSLAFKHPQHSHFILSHLNCQRCRFSYLFFFLFMLSLPPPRIPHSLWMIRGNQWLL